MIIRIIIHPDEKEVRLTKRCFDCAHCRESYNDGKTYHCKKGQIIVKVKNNVDCKDYESMND